MRNAMFRMTRPAAVAVLIASMGLPAIAAPIEIATLGRAPLMGQSTSASELKYNFQKNEPIVRRAAMAVGLTPEQWQQFRLAMDVGRSNWVTVPRHLDAMTWASGGQIHVLHDVIIPANQKGIEVDLNTGSQIVAVFLPAKCGNLSLLRRALPHVAAIRNFPVPRVAAAVAPPPPPPAQDVAAVVAPPPPPEQPVAVATALPPAVAASHGLGFLPLAALIPFLFGGGGAGNTGGGGGTIVAPPPCP
jgi:hypothetical protein